ncbi:MAG: hypothetical protein GF417_10575 [Candidatus Latescibacteria bacterium]|nr:hypothetical protein [bacterium]MBD3424871.1 hypothetical protein [Candidatus Latescibacterota bacterium]
MTVFFLITLNVQESAGASGDTFLDYWDFSFHLEGGIIGQHYEPEEASIDMPDYIRSRKIYSPLASRHPELHQNTLTDNPLIHAATFNEISMEARRCGLKITSRLLMEHRGMSCGVYNMENTALIPKLNISADSSFSLSGEEIHFGLSAGNYDNITIGKGLTLYNIDLQGICSYLRWGRVKAGYNSFGDLVGSYDIMINDAAYYSLSLMQIHLIERLELDIEAGLYKYLAGDEGNTVEDEISLGFEIRRGKSLRIYSETGLRNYNDTFFDRIDQGANLVGIALNLERDRFDFTAAAERRYYGRYFNLGFASESGYFNFRENSGNLSHNSIGTHLYPVSHFLRPFSQWAVYTEYQGKDVSSYILQADLSYDFPGGLFASSHIDFNYILASNEDPFLYPFYRVAAGWKPLERSRCSIGITNRAMNLDEQYPTLYLLKSPVVEMSWLYHIEF